MHQLKLKLKMGEDITDFIITCKKCDSLKRKHETTLYVDWKKKYYMIMCFTCKFSEAFDEKGRKITKDSGEN